jgi:hypothetical protein
VAVEAFVLHVVHDVVPTRPRCTATCGDRLDRDPALAAKARYDGAGRRPAGTPERAPRRDARR